MQIRSSKTKLFLIELIIIILFFAIASVVCMNIFAAAKTTNVKSTDTTHALFVAQEAADAVRAGNADQLSELLGGSFGPDGGSVFYDEKWQPTEDAAGAKYSMEVFADRKDGMLTCQIQVKKAHATLFETTVKHFDGKEAA